MTPFPKRSKIMKNGRNWTHIALPGLRIKHFESQGCQEANGSPPDPKNYSRRCKIQQKSKGPHRKKCTLNSSVNRMTCAEIGGLQNLSRAITVAETSAPEAPAELCRQLACCSNKLKGTFGDNFDHDLNQYIVSCILYLIFYLA